MLSHLPFLLTLLLAFVLVTRVSALRVQGLSLTWHIVALTARIAAGALLLLLYSSYIDIDRKDADVLKYYDDGIVMSEAGQESMGTFWAVFSGEISERTVAYQDGMNNWVSADGRMPVFDDRVMIRLHALVGLWSKGDVRIHVIVFALLGYIGLVFLFKGMRLLSVIPPRAFLLICIVPPSLLLWSSAMLKESILLLPLGLAMWGLAKVCQRQGGYLVLGFGLILLIALRPYVGAAFLGMAAYLVLTYRYEVKISKALLGLGLAGALVLTLGQFFPRLDIVALLSQKQADFLHLAGHTGAGSLVEVTRFDDLFSFLIQTPEAVFRALFRPMVWEIRSALDGISAVENLLYLLLIATAIACRRAQIDWRLIIGLGIFVLILAIIVGSTTPILGAVVRYKTPMLPFLILCIFAVSKTPSKLSSQSTRLC